MEQSVMDPQTSCNPGQSAVLPDHQYRPVLLTDNLCQRGTNCILRLNPWQVRLYPFAGFSACLIRTTRRSPLRTAASSLLFCEKTLIEKSRLPIRAAALQTNTLYII